MRSNGLTAPSYTPVADLDPVLATALLDDLKHQGVAAYTKPVESSTTSGFDRPEFRVRVRDRLYVDAAAFGRVRELLSERDPTLLDDNEDLTWAQLVAGFDQPLADDVVPWPAIEDISPSHDGAAPTTPTSGGHDDPGPEPGEPAAPSGLTRSRRRTDPEQSEPVRPPDQQPQSRGDAFDDGDFLASTSKAAPADEEDGGFVPDPPPPLPSVAPHRLVAWIGLVVGPLLLLVVAVFRYTPPGWLTLIGVVGFIGGFVTLVATMADADDGDWGPDNGAVV